MVLLVLAGSLLAGCLAPDEPQDRADAAPDAPRRPVVVAIIDSGVDPYHAAFRAEPHGVEKHAEFITAAGARLVNLSSEGDYDARVAADDAFWSGAEAGRLYAFSGTRLLSVSTSHDPQGPPILGDADHGTSVASLVAREAPDAVIVMIQIDGTICDPFRPFEDCSILSRAAPAMAWAAAQPWVDVISMSIGDPGNVPYHPAYDPGMRPFLDASRLAHESGKVVVAASGNSAVPPLAGYYAGPPWIISTGGVYPKARTEAWESGKAVDVVANYTDYVARAGSLDTYTWRGGTSFASPTVAGVLARTLGELHARGHEPQPGEMRAALNATAVHWAATEWDPTKPPTNNTLRNLLTHGVPVVAPAAQMGWGYVHGGLVDELVRRVLEDDFSVPPQKAGAAEHQARWQGVREAYWRNHA